MAGMAGAGAVAAPISAPAAAPAGVGATQMGGVSATVHLGSGMPAGMQQLVASLQGFSTAEILMALMLLGGGQDDKKKCPDAAMAMLAGLALAGQISGFATNVSASVPGIGAGAGGGVGLQVNFQV